MAFVTRASADGLIMTNYAAQTLSNTTTETTLFSGVIPGGTLATDRGLRLTYHASLTSLLTPPSITVRVKFGGTTVTAVAGIAILANATGRTFTIEVKLVNRGATNNQYIVCLVRNPGALAVLTGLAVMEEVSATAAVDTTTNQTLSITAQFSAAINTTTLTTQLVEAMVE